MSVLAHSELLQRIMGIEETALEKPFALLSKTRATQKRLAALRELAKKEPATIGQVLQALHENKGGGSYLTIRAFFRQLEEGGMLKHESINNRNVWAFSQAHLAMKKFILQE